MGAVDRTRDPDARADDRFVLDARLREHLARHAGGGVEGLLGLAVNVQLTRTLGQHVARKAADGYLDMGVAEVDSDDGFG